MNNKYNLLIKKNNKWNICINKITEKVARKSV